MSHEWSDNQPIYRQLRDMVVERIMDGSFAEGSAIPSVRQVSADYHINHLTVARAYQELVELELLEKRRGLGMYVTRGARSAITSDERQHFIDEESPAFAGRARMLGMELERVVGLLRKAGGES